MYNKKMYACTKMGIWIHVHNDLEKVKLYGSGPYFEVSIREVKKGENSPYWAWKDFEEKKYLFIQPSMAQTEQCGTNFESREERGKGKLVNLVIKEVKEIKNP